MSQEPGPGYYPDPEDPSRPRWWDGQAWGPPVPAESPPPDLRALFGVEQRLAVVAAAALLIGIGVWIAASVLHLMTADDTRAMYREVVAALEENRTPRDVGGETSAGTTVLTQLVFTGQVVIGVVFASWCYRAAAFARAAGIAGSWPPVWAYLGFLPGLVFVIPYFVTRGLAPPGHPARLSTSRWFSSWLAMQLGVAVTFAVPLLTDVGFGFLAACTLGVAVLVVAAGVAGRQMIVAVTAHHAQVAGVLD